MDYYEPRDDLDEVPFVPPDEPTPIQRVYEGATIFITGATGFMGKVLMEKLLRSCNVAKIYILVRDKKGVKSKERLTTLFDDVFFEPLKLQKPGEIAKVSIVTGDCTVPDLGLSEADKATMSDVNIIFHAAATLYMDQHLKSAFVTNVVATKSLLEFAKTLPRLQAFIYVSTAYTHAYRGKVEETFYDVVYDDEELEVICDQMDDVQIGAMTPKLTNRWSDTYALTKACAENLIRKYEGVLPIGVVRPSIVMSTWDEPLQGWVNNLYGAMGVVTGTALGLLRVWCAGSDMIGDLIPVDIAINMTLAATWEVVTTNTRAKVYNCVSSTKNPINWNFLQTTIFSINDQERIDSTKSIAVPDLRLVESDLMLYLYSLWYHVIPAIFIDIFLKITGKRPILLKAYAKVFKFNKMLKPYCVDREIRFTSNNVNRLWEVMGQADKTIFNFDLNALDWNCFFLRALKGGRVYFVKDPMETIPEGRRKTTRLRLRKYIFDSLVWMGVSYVIYWSLNYFVFSYFVN